MRRTRDALGDALVALMHEKPFDEIALQEVLARAGVGRSTFYEHFRSKDDLFHSDADDFFGHIANALAEKNSPSDRVAPVRELLEHLREMRTFVDAIFASGKAHENFSLGREHFARGIERRLSQIPRAAALSAADRAAFAQAQAGALMALVQWWLHRGMKENPAELDAFFHRQLWNGAVGMAPASR